MSYTMKPSGVDWIGDIPAHWEVKRVKDLCYPSISKTTSIPTFYVGMEHVESGTGIFNPVLLNDYAASTYNVLEKGTFGFGKLRPYLAKLFQANTLVAASTEFLLFKLDSNSNPGYVKYYLLNNTFITHLNDLVSGAKMPRVSWPDFSNQSILIQPPAEQRAIASFLDDRTAAIDSKISALEEKEQSLAELRKSIIHEAVTKGLDPKVPMKASGVDWIGDIPAHWTLNRVKCVFKEVSVKGFPNETLLAATQGQGVIPKALVGWRTVEAKQDGRENFKLVQPGMFVISLRSFEGGIEYSNYRGIISSAYTVLDSQININKAYFKHMFKSQSFIEGLGIHQKGIRDGQSITFSTWANDQLICPPLSEQRAIASFLDDRTCVIDQSIDTVKKEIEALQELRKSLIHEAVTGKLDVADFGYNY